jgi:hypothetical protein
MRGPPGPVPRWLGALAAIIVPQGAMAQETAPPPETSPPPEASPAPVAASAPSPAPAAEPAPLQRAAAPYVPPATEPEPTGGFGANLGVGFSFVPNPPDMALTTPDGGAMKQFSAFPVSHIAGMNMVDLAASVFYRTASPLLIPLLGFEFGIPVSTGYPESIALGTNAGSLTWQRGGPTYYDGLDILGLGLLLSSGTFRFAVDALPGFRYVFTTGTITEGLLTIDAEARQYSFSLHADVSVCAGAKGAVSVCVYGVPHVFEFGHGMNGATFGARIETN